MPACARRPLVVEGQVGGAGASMARIPSACTQGFIHALAALRATRSDGSHTWAVDQCIDDRGGWLSLLLCRCCRCHRHYRPHIGKLRHKAIVPAGRGWLRAGWRKRWPRNACWAMPFSLVVLLATISRSADAVAVHRVQQRQCHAQFPATQR